MGGRRIPRERGARLEAWSYRLLLPRFSYLYNRPPLFTFLFIYSFWLCWVLAPICRSSLVEVCSPHCHRLSCDGAQGLGARAQ